MVCTKADLANMARLVGITILDSGKEHLKAMKWVKSTLSRGLLHRRTTNCMDKNPY